MVRILDGILPNVYLIFGGWIIATVMVAILIKLNPDFDNNELAEYAALGAFVFFVQSFIIIPINFFGLFFTLSGIPFVVMVKGIKRGLLISSAAIILNHIFIPGAFSMLGVNLTNMLISGLIAGLIPSILYERTGRRIRYLSGLIAGLTYFACITVLITLELAFSVVGLTFTNIVYLVIVVVFLLGLLEGFLTAIGSSYYHRMRHPKYVEEIEDEEEEDDIEPIHFYDD